MKGKITVSVMMSAVLLLVLCAFAQGARQDSDARLTSFQTRLNQEGFDVTLGRAETLDLLGDFYAGTIPEQRP